MRKVNTDVNVNVLSLYYHIGIVNQEVIMMSLFTMDHGMMILIKSNNIRKLFYPEHISIVVRYLKRWLIKFIIAIMLVP